MIVGFIYICLGLDQQPHHIGVPCLACDGERCGTIIVCDVDIGLALDQQSCYIDVAIKACD